MGERFLLRSPAQVLRGPNSRRRWTLSGGQGSRYRLNAFAMAEELSGAVVQVLNYQHELVSNVHSLLYEQSGPAFSAFNPRCIIIAGSLAGEAMSAEERKSFELFRSALGPVTILTYDEIFGRVQDLVDMVLGEVE